MLSEIKQALRIDYPIRAEAVMRFALGRRLDFEPGQRFAYSNVGYLILARVIESVSGETYEAYLRKSVLNPLGITQMQLAHARPDSRPKTEVSYFDRDRRTGPCIYPPNVGQIVPLADGGFNIEGYEAHGGWIASAIDLVRFACAFDDPGRCPLLSADSIARMFERPRFTQDNGDGHDVPAAYYGCGWNVRPVKQNSMNTWHDGLLIPGSSTLLVRRSDGLTWAVLFNTDKGVNGTVLAGAIDPMLHRAADTVRAWPDTDLFPDYYP
jgi:N-acyl-D-amino-acid deacylase